ncbi:MAG: hypothetical protein ACRC49_10675 [Plesiomonas sp.]
MPELMEDVEAVEKPVEVKAKMSPAALALVAAISGLGGLAGGVAIDAPIAEAEKDKIIAVDDSLKRSQAKVKITKDSIISAAVIAPVDVDIVDSAGKILRTEKQMREVKPRNVNNCNTKYNCPIVTTGDEVFTTTTVLSRTGKLDSTLSVIVDRPIANRLHVVYTTTAEK